MDEQEPVCVATYPAEMQAEMARMRLETNGIDAFIIKDDCGGMLPFFQAITGVRLMVRAEEADQAAQILAQAEGESWRSGTDNGDGS